MNVENPTEERVMNQQMRQVLAELELVSHGSTQSWNSDGRGGLERLFPPGELFPPHVHYRHLWDRATSDDGRAGVYREARAALKEITRRDPTKPKGLGEREIMLRNVLDHSGSSAAEIAMHYRYSVRQVRTIMMQEGRNPDSGVIDPDLTPGGSQEAWAALLKDRGLSQEQIAERMSISQPTVSRLLKFRRVA